MSFAGFGYVPYTKPLKSGARSTADGPSRLTTRSSYSDRRDTQRVHADNSDQDSRRDDDEVDVFTDRQDEGSNSSERNIVPEVIKLDMNIKKNAKVHHTDEFDILSSKNAAVLRRGEVFTFELKFNKPLVKFSSKNLAVTLTLGSDPSIGKGTKAIIGCDSTPSQRKDTIWWGEVVQVQSDQTAATIRINICSFAPIGHWSMQCVIKDSSGYKFDTSFDDIYILFNPWCKVDQVYMSDPDLVDEYIMNESGKIWKGAWNNFHATPWTFGQFDDPILEACMRILETSYLKTHQCGNAVHVSRAISAMVNANDDDGVLYGRWESPYDSGKEPWFWSGSPAILRKYFQEKRAVRYGQCWVFSALVTTVCRCLGIPARSVTNFCSAHDVDCSLTIEEYYNDDGKELHFNRSGNGKDSIWNFHVWNDVWMARPDLPPGYDGWQAIDATPQEFSGGIMQCGPAPVTAIKQGQLGLSYDIPFIFAEVNADRVKWRWNKGEDEPPEIIKVEADACGWYISTKAPRKRIAQGLAGPDGREDLTLAYKHKEYTQSEREKFKRAISTGGYQHTEEYLSQFKKQPNEVEVNLVMPKKKVMIGKHVRIEAQFRNGKKGTSTVDYTMNVSCSNYIGRELTRFKKKSGRVQMKANDVAQCFIDLEPSEYYQYLKSQGGLHISLVGYVAESKQRLVTASTFNFTKPSLKLSIEGDPQVGKRFKVACVMENPLPRVLKNGRITIEGPGIKNHIEYELRDLEPGKRVRVRGKIRPWKTGERTLIAKFTSDQLDDIDGYIDIQVVA